MATAQSKLNERVRELRRRHFGARGKVELAKKLAISLEELDRYERGTVPPADVLVRICEITGEDLQWLLTGVASRGTVVISGARGRHQALLAKVAQMVESHPHFAAPIEAFLELLSGTGKRGPDEPRKLLPHRALIPIFEMTELPQRLEFPANETAALAIKADMPLSKTTTVTARMAEPSAHYVDARYYPIKIIREESAGARRRFIECIQLADCAEALFAVSISDEEMAPMFAAGDAAIATMTSASRVGCPAILKLASERKALCRMWLGETDHAINLGRVSDGAVERVEANRILWSYEVIFRVCAA